MGGRGTASYLQSPLFLHHLLRCPINSSLEFLHVNQPPHEMTKWESTEAGGWVLGQWFLLRMGTGGMVLSDKDTEAQVQTHPKSGSCSLSTSPGLHHSLPVLEGPAPEARRDDGSKQDLWGHADLGSDPPFTFYAHVTIGKLPTVFRPHLLPLQNGFCSSHCENEEK